MFVFDIIIRKIILRDSAPRHNHKQPVNDPVTRGLTEDEDINEHMVLNQSKMEAVLEGDAGATLIDLEEIKSSVNEGGEEIEEEEPERENLRMVWFRKLPEKQVLPYKSTVNLLGTKELNLPAPTKSSKPKILRSLLQPLHQSSGPRGSRQQKGLHGSSSTV